MIVRRPPFASSLALQDNALRRESPAGRDSGAGEPVSASGHFRSRVIKRSIVVAGHKTSVSLEDVFWNELRAIAQSRGVHLSQLVGSIDQDRQHNNLSSAIRLFVFDHIRNHSSTDVH